MEEYFEDSDDDVEASETDETYEFEASRFYDFTRPEFDYEIEEAERWFEDSGDYPLSPFIVKLDLEKLLSPEASRTKSIGSSSENGSPSSVPDSKNDAKGKSNITPQETEKVKTSSDDKLLQSRSPSFMEPTASNLAKQKGNHKHSGHICTRFQKKLAKVEQKGLQSLNDYNLETKRQKLDIGYLKKVAHLKHQFLLVHKSSKKSSKKVTIPKEPELETMLRAQRQRSKVSSATSESESQKQKFCHFKALPLNRKILEPRLSSQPKKTPPRLPYFQVFHLKTMERANYHASTKVHPAKTDIDIIQAEKQKITNFHQESGSSVSDKFLENPPTEQFSKISLGPNMKTSSASQAIRCSSVKGKKKGDCDPIQADSRKCNPKPSQCGDHMRLHEAKCRSDVSRSLDIRSESN